MQPKTSKAQAMRTIATLSPHNGEPPTTPRGGPNWTLDQFALLRRPMAERGYRRDFFSRAKAAPIRVGREGVKAWRVFEAA
jgi:hypothetical protein